MSIRVQQSHGVLKVRFILGVKHLREQVMKLLENTNRIKNEQTTNSDHITGDRGTLLCAGTDREMNLSETKWVHRRTTP
jgi:hypothetical protein